MSLRTHFPSPSDRARPPGRARRARLGLRAPLAPAAALLSLLGLLGAGWPRPVRAHDLFLEGPHPSLRENALSVSYLLGTGLGHSFSGQGLGLDYGYKASPPLWVDLQLNFRGSTCPPWRGACGPYTGNDVEALAGLAWHFRLEVPVVPFVHANAGLVFLYPDGATSAVGLGGRVGAGAKYFVFDWLGFGGEIALSLGHGFFSSPYTGSRTYAVADMVLGVELQFD